MTIPRNKRIGITLSGFCLLIGAASAFSGPINEQEMKETIMIANGRFEIQMMPKNDGDYEMGRMTLDKTYEGDMEGTGKGQMLSLRTGVEGSAGYVAMEQVTATLNGRSGSFTLQHSGSMEKGDSSLQVAVVPDSGTGELVGISGAMDIIIENGKHFYRFTYQLGPSAREE